MAVQDNSSQPTGGGGCCGSAHDHAHHGHDQAMHHNAGEVASVIDPVCGMTVNPATSQHRHDYKGEPWHFCSSGCRAKFAADPETYLKSTKAEAPQAPAGTIYTCPMHPEIRQDGPGACPICGMALELVTATIQDGPNSELTDMLLVY